jgi:hypothetical protein
MIITESKGEEALCLHACCLFYIIYHQLSHEHRSIRSLGPARYRYWPDWLADGRQDIIWNLDRITQQKYNVSEWGQAGRVPVQGKRNRKMQPWSMHARRRKREAIARPWWERRLPRSFICASRKGTRGTASFVYLVITAKLACISKLKVIMGSRSHRSKLELEAYLAS